MEKVVIGFTDLQLLVNSQTNMAGGEACCHWPSNKSYCAWSNAKIFKNVTILIIILTWFKFQPHFFKYRFYCYGQKMHKLQDLFKTHGSIFLWSNLSMFHFPSSGKFSKTGLSVSFWTQIFLINLFGRRYEWSRGEVITARAARGWVMCCWLGLWLVIQHKKKTIIERCICMYVCEWV
jgi:hypothetical protein